MITYSAVMVVSVFPTIILKFVHVPVVTMVNIVNMVSVILLAILPYTVKLSSGKTFAVVHKIHYSLENFCGVSGRSHHTLYMHSKLFKGKTFAIGSKTAKVFPLKSFAVYGIHYHGGC